MTDTTGYDHEFDKRILARRNHELTILNSIAQALHREIDLDRALRVVLAQITELFDLTTGWIFLVREESQESYLAASHNLPPGLVEHSELMSGSCYCLDTYFAGNLDGAANVNIIRCTRLNKLVSGSNGLRSHASVPLYAQGQKLGVLNVASTQWRELSEDDLRLLYTVGDLLSIAVERARLFANRAEIGALQERNRLARELHDTLAQGLSAISLQLETADALLDAQAEAERVRTYVQQALALTQHNLEEARRSVLDLRSAPLDGCTLPEALANLVHEQAEKQGQQNGPEILFLRHGDNRPLPAHQELGLYRIAQEAFNNALDHANAGRVHLAITVHPHEVRLVIEDDGRGFDADALSQLASDGHFGLVGMSERAHLLGATLDIQSCPGTGTQIMVGLHSRANAIETEERPVAPENFYKE